MLWSILFFHKISAQSCFNEINFESIPGDSLHEGLLIGNQYAQTLGISFKLEDGTLPQIAKVGAPTTAFSSQFGADIPSPNQGIGSFFLTDDGELNDLDATPLIITFSSPLDSASGVTLDIDHGEQFTIQARDVKDSILTVLVIQAGDQETGDGIATPWGFKRDQPDIHSIKFIGTRTQVGGFGLGFDKFVACVVPQLEPQIFCNKISFDFIPNNILYEGLIVSDQYFQSHGISFELENGEFPRLAKVGDPVTAFVSSLGGDMPMPNQDIDEFFLTDDGELLDIDSSPLIVSFLSPLDSASGVALDIDGGEQFIIQAKNRNDSILTELVINAGDQGTGDGIATSWGFKRDQPDIHSIKFIGTREDAGGFGFGFDNFVSCTVNDFDLITTNSCISLYPDADSETFVLRGDYSNFDVYITDENGMIIQNLSNSTSAIYINTVDLPSGLHFLNVIHKTNNDLHAKLFLKAN